MTGKHKDARQARVDLGLRELAGHESPPDLVATVAKHVAETGGRVHSRPRVGRSSLSLPLAAVALLGIGITIAVFLAERGGSANPAAQAGLPEAGSSEVVPAQQDPIDIEELPATFVTAVEEARRSLEREHRVILSSPSAAMFEALQGRGRWLLGLETGVSHQDEPVSAQALPALAKLTPLRMLRLKFADDIGEDDLRVLAGLPVLERLEIWGGSLTGEDLRVLARFPSLKYLVLRGPDCQDGGFAFLEKLPRLHGFDVDGAYGLTAEDLQPIRHLTQLRELSLHDVNGLWPFSSRRPTREEADGIGADDTVIAHLAGMTELRVLNLGGLQAVTATGLAALENLEHLTWLDVTNCSGVSSEGFAKLPASLEVLLAQGTDIDGRALANLERLRECSLEWCTELTDGDLEALTAARGLEVLNLTYTKAMTPAAAEHLRAFPKMRELNLFGAPWLRDEHLEVIGGMSELRSLSIGGLLPITDTGIEHLKGLRVEVLDLRGNEHVTPTGIWKLKDWPLRQVMAPRRLRDAVGQVWPTARAYFG